MDKDRQEILPTTVWPPPLITTGKASEPTIGNVNLRRDFSMVGERHCQMSNYGSELAIDHRLQRYGKMR